jgi:hypothetical protein
MDKFLPEFSPDQLWLVLLLAVVLLAVSIF